MKICANCQTKNDNNKAKCVKCGGRMFIPIDDAELDLAAAATTQMKVAKDSIIPEKQQANQPKTRKSLKQRPKSVKRKFYGAVILLCLIVIFGAGLSMYSQSSKERLAAEEPTSNIQLNNPATVSDKNESTQSAGSAYSKEETTASQTESVETLPLQLEWSSWDAELPSYVNETAYNVEKRVLYSYKELEKTSSTSSSMPGWELYDTKEGNGDFGNWSDWSSSEAYSSDTREVETQTRYRYKDKETTTSSSSSLSGWELYDTTYSWSDYGSWSDWVDYPVFATDYRKIEVKTQYRYRDVSYSTEYTDWGAWSSWQDGYVSSDDLTDVETRTAYHYYYYICDYCGKHLPGKGYCYNWDGGCGRNNVTGDYSYTTIRSTIPYDSIYDFSGVGMRYITIDGEKVFAFTNPSSGYYIAPITQYRYRTRSTFEFGFKNDWSDWSDNVYYESDTREVAARELVRFCERTQIPTYHFYRWGEWSSWSTSFVSSSDNREVETATFYRHRDRLKEKTYYYRRWTDWSDYSTGEMYESDTMKVRTKIEYRFKSKN